MRFLHLSDIHFLRKYHKAEKGYNSIFNNMTNPVEQIKSCLKKVDLKTIDFIIIFLIIYKFKKCLKFIIIDIFFIFFYCHLFDFPFYIIICNIDIKY